METIDAETIRVWRINYGLDVRSPADAMRWWNDNNNGLAPCGAVAALGLCLDRIAELERKNRNQRTELRRLNKLLGPYWLGFRAGFAKESELKLRVAMNRAFGYEAVRKAEHDAIDAAMKETDGKT